MVYIESAPTKEETKAYLLSAVGIQGLTRSKVAEMLKDEDFIPARNPFTVLRLAHENWDETTCFLVEICGVNMEYLREEWHISLVASILTDLNTPRLRSKLEKKFWIHPTVFKGKSREEILSIFFTHFFNKRMAYFKKQESYMQNIDKANLYKLYSYANTHN